MSGSKEPQDKYSRIMAAIGEKLRRRALRKYPESFTELMIEELEAE